jgi:hypothetical protein
MRLDDFNLMLSERLPSAHLSSGSAFSLISNTPVLTHKLVPGLSGLCATPKGLMAVFFVDELPTSDKLAGIMFYTARRKATLHDPNALTPHWLIQLQQGSFAWQIMTTEHINGQGTPLPFALFLKWKPGSFARAIEKHHDLVRALPSEGFDLDTDLERVATSTFMLSEGLSCVANAYLAEPWVREAYQHQSVKNVDDPCVEAIRCIPVEWEVNTDAMEA